MERENKIWVDGAIFGFVFTFILAAAVGSGVTCIQTAPHPVVGVVMTILSIASLGTLGQLLWYLTRICLRPVPVKENPPVAEEIKEWTPENEAQTHKVDSDSSQYQAWLHCARRLQRLKVYGGEENELLDLEETATRLFLELSPSEQTQADMMSGDLWKLIDDD